MSQDYITIPLSKYGKNRGKYEAIVDLVDSDLAELNWRAKVLKHTQYAFRSIYENGQYNRAEYLHRAIMERILGHAIPDGMQVDHIDMDGLNNRRSNLRLATRTQNMQNQGKQTNNTSGFKGVCWDKQMKKWRAAIKINRKQKTLGLFNTPQEAHAAYCAAADKLHGEFANYGNIN